MILSFAKPDRVRSVEEWKNDNSADGAPPGVYVPNMSKGDQLLWKAKVVGTRSGDHQIEIRSMAPGSNLVVIVNGSMPNRDKALRYQKALEETPHSIKISANGPTFYTKELWEAFQKAISEAHSILESLDSKDHVRRGICLGRIKSGLHPLEKDPVPRETSL